MSECQQHDDEEHFLELWNDFLEGELYEDGLAEVQQMLAADDRLLKMAADSFELHRLLGLQAAESPQRREAFIRATLAQLPNPTQSIAARVMSDVRTASNHSAPIEVANLFGTKLLLASAAAMLILLLGGWTIHQLSRQSSSASIASISGLSGSVLWTGDGGQIVRDLAIGQELNGGTLEGMAPSSWAELTFHDGSTVTISGKSMLTFSERQRKELYLRDGHITADIAPQPAGKPMWIHTRTADLEVLGTQFSVEAELASTMLNVSEGRVRVKRLTDNQQVEVPAQHRLVAAADSQFVPERTPNFINQWQSRLDLGPIDSLGKWSPKTEERAARLRAIPFIFQPPGSGSEERSMTLYLAAIPVSRGDSQPVMIQPRSRFRIRGGLGKAERLYFGFQVNHADGSFAGKFLAEAQPDFSDTIESPDRFEVPLQIEDFRLDPSLSKLEDRIPTSPIGLVISSCWCFTLNPADLELEQVQIDCPD